MMQTQITVLAIGLRGDVVPLLALAQALHQQGYAIRFATHPQFASLVTAAGLEFFAIAADPEQLLQHHLQGIADHKRRSLLQSRLTLFRQIRPFMLTAATACQQACQSSQLILFSPFGFFFAPSLAEHLKIPAIAAYSYPFLLKTKAFPLVAISKQLGSVFNQLSWRIAERLIFVPFRSVINQWRQQKLGLAPLSLWNRQTAMQPSQWPVLLAISPSLLPKPADWSQQIHLCGYWFPPQQTDWQAPPVLLDFLQTRPIGITFGSMSKAATALLPTLFEAIHQLGHHALVIAPQQESAWVQLHPHVLQLGITPYQWLFPQLAAIVHHGGAGTTAAALRAGKPQLVMPLSFDQPFWARQITTQGVGLSVRAQSRPSVAQLKKLLQQVLNNAHFQQQANRFAKAIEAEQGIDQAIKQIASQLNPEK